MIIPQSRPIEDAILEKVTYQKFLLAGLATLDPIDRLIFILYLMGLGGSTRLSRFQFGLSKPSIEGRLKKGKQAILEAKRQPDV